MLIRGAAMRAPPAARIASCGSAAKPGRFLILPGHSKVGITLGLYSHVFPGMQEDAVAKVDAALRAAQSG